MSDLIDLMIAVFCSVDTYLLPKRFGLSASSEV